MRNLSTLAVAAVLFGGMALAVKAASRHLPGPEVAFFRFVIGLVTVGVAHVFVRRMHVVNGRGLFLRGLFGGAAVYLFFLAIEHMPVGIATLLNYTAPVFTAVWALFFLGERLQPSTIVALILTGLGVALVVRGAGATSSSVSAWYLVGVASAALSGAAVATIRAIRKTDGAWEIFGAFCIGGILLTGPSTLHRWVTPTSTDWAILGLVGALSAVAQVMMTYALRFVPATPAGVMLQLTPITALLFGYAFFDERLSTLAWIGSGLTVLGVSYGARQASRAVTSKIASEYRS